jgi:hypothetical protein
MGNGIVLLSVSSDWMDDLEVLALGMTGSGGTRARLASALGGFADASNLIVVSQLSLLQSKAHLTSPPMEVTPCGPSILKTK